MAEDMAIDYLDKVRGMLYGVALGDSLGAPHEFRQSIPLTKYTGRLEYKSLVPSRFQGDRWGVIGQWTDDTEMTLALANSILRNKGYNRDDVIRVYQDWANSHPFGMGKNTRRLFYGVKTVKGYEQRYNKALQEDLNQTQSNGSLMRATPLALLVDLDDPDSFKDVIEDIYLSNPNPVNEEAGLIYVTALALALRGVKEEIILDTITQEAEGMSPEIKVVIYQVNEGLARDIKTNKGWVVHSLYCSLMSLRYYHLAIEEDNERSFTTAINEIILMGGDTDTNGAIAGGLLGALVGYQRLLKQGQAENIDIIRNIKTEEGDFPRPDIYHPKSIDELAERLVKIFPE